MKLRVNYLFIALFGLSTSLVYANPILGLAQIPGLHAIQSLLAPLGLVNPPFESSAIEVDTGAAVIHDTTGIEQAYHVHESHGHQYPIVVDESHHLPATSVIVEQPVVVEKRKHGKFLKLIDYLWNKKWGSKKSHKHESLLHHKDESLLHHKHESLLHHNHKEIEPEAIIIKQEVPVYITKHVPQPYPVQHTVVKEVKVPYPVKQTVVKEVGIPQPYPVEHTVVKEVKVPEPYQVTQTVVKEVKVPEPYAVTKTVVKEVGIPQPYPVTKTVVKEVGVPQPYPVTKTVVKEVPVVHKVKEFVPFKISVPEPVAVPIIKTVKEHHLLQPVVEQKTVIEHHQHNEILTPLPEPEPEILVEDDKALITPVVPATEKSIEIVASPQPVHNEYGLPPVKSFQPFNSEYELPAHGTDNTGFGKSNTEGEYVSAYVLNDGTKVSEEGHLIKGSMGNDVLVKKGNYEYTDKNGKEIKVDWVADELGFRILNE